MLRKLSAALLATALIAGPAFAAAPAAGNQSAPAATTAPAKHASHHRLRHRPLRIKSAHHLKRTKTHHSRVAAHSGKPAKTGKTDKGNNTSKMNNNGARTHG